MYSVDLISFHMAAVVPVIAVTLLSVLYRVEDVKMASINLPQSLAKIALPVIDYNGLIKKDILEIEKIVKVAAELGFFYLKLGERLTSYDCR